MTSPIDPQFPSFLPELMSAVFFGIAFLAFSRNVPAKRIVLPVTLVAAAALALTMIWVQFRGHLPWFFVLIIAASLLATYRGVVFCSSCRRTSRGTIFRSVQFCPRCGAPTHS